MSKKNDLTGQVFGKLTVLGEDGRTESGHVRYRCICECGRETTARGSDLIKGCYTSCGSLGCKNVKYPKKNEEPMGIKKDCFAYVARGSRHLCSAMNEVYCLKGQCKFYAPLEKVCENCKNKDCDRCLTVSYQKQTENK